MRLVGDLVIAGFGQIKNARIDNLSSDPVSPQSGQVWYNTTDLVYRGFNGTAIITFATGGSTAVLQAEIDKIEASAGMDVAGNYIVKSAANYIAAATTLAAADDLLDSAAKANANAIIAETTRATGIEGQLRTDLTAETTRATGIEGGLRTDLTAETTRATGIEGGLRTDLTAETTRATGIEGGLRTDLTALAAAVIKKDGSVAYTGDQSMNSHKITNVSAPVVDGDAANKAYVDGKISSLGAVFEYAGKLNGAGVDGAAAFDLETLTTKHSGSYYKVATAGFFKVGAGDPFYVSLTDGLVFNTAGGVDKIDNTNSVVQGTTNFIAVAGNSDAGFIVDVATNFKTRVSTLETDLVDEVTRATGIEGGLRTDLTAETTRATTAEGAEVTRATTAEAALGTRLTNSQFVYDGSTSSTSHVVVHNLGNKYNQVIVVDSNDKVILPDAITFNSVTQLTVDFISAITCKVIVSSPKV